MNDHLPYVPRTFRQVGKTYETAQAVKRLSSAGVVRAVMVCHGTNAYAKSVADKFGIETVSVDGLERWRGTSAVFLWDPDAVTELSLRYIARIDQLNERIDNLAKEAVASNEARLRAAQVLLGTSRVDL